MCSHRTCLKAGLGSRQLLQPAPRPSPPRTLTPTPGPTHSHVHLPQALPCLDFNSTCPQNASPPGLHATGLGTHRVRAALAPSAPAPIRAAPPRPGPRVCSAHLKAVPGRRPSLEGQDLLQGQSPHPEGVSGGGPAHWLDLGGPRLTLHRAARRDRHSLGCQLPPFWQAAGLCQPSQPSRAPGPVPSQFPLRAAWLYDFTG